MTSQVLVDSNVLLDVITDDPKWGAWSADPPQRKAKDASVDLLLRLRVERSQFAARFFAVTAVAVAVQEFQG